MIVRLVEVMAEDIVGGAAALAAMKMRATLIHAQFGKG